MPWGRSHQCVEQPTHCKACVSPQGLRWFWFTVVSVLCSESAKRKNLLKKSLHLYKVFFQAKIQPKAF